MADTVVPLTPADQVLVTAWVEAMTLLKRTQKCRGQLSWADQAVYERAGKLGEVAFSHVFGYPVDWHIHAGGDKGIDFTLSNGETVDVKAVKVAANMRFDYNIPLERDKPPATYYVQVLIAPAWDYAVITGGISRVRFLREGVVQKGWTHRGTIEPLVIQRRRLSQAYPAAFWAHPLVGVVEP